MNQVKVLLIAIFIVSLAGCATPYQKMGKMGGYTDGRIDDDTFWVKFNGNGYTSGEKAFSYCMRRAAEVTLENGYSYFAILSKSNKVSYQKNTYAKIDSKGNYAGEGQLWTTKRPHLKIVFDVFKVQPEVEDGKIKTYFDSKKFLNN